MISQYIHQRRYVDRCLLDRIIAENLVEVCLASHIIKNTCSNKYIANIPRLLRRLYSPHCSISHGLVRNRLVLGTSLKDHNILFNCSVRSTANVCFMPRYISMAHFSKCFCADVGVCRCYSLGMWPLPGVLMRYTNHASLWREIYMGLRLLMTLSEVF